MTSPKMSAREALEAIRSFETIGRFVSLEHEARYARACAILAALVDEAEACDRPPTVESFNAWSDATAKRRALERGEES